MKCPNCQESFENHQAKKALCPEVGCWCKNCYWCGHQIQMVDWAVDMDHKDALELDRATEAEAFPEK